MPLDLERSYTGARAPEAKGTRTASDRGCVVSRDRAVLNGCRVLAPQAQDRSRAAL